MDFIPNHVARTYHSDACPEGVADLGATDDVQLAFSPRNNFYYLPDTSLILPLSTESSPYTECPARATGNDCFSPYPQHQRLVRDGEAQLRGGLLRRKVAYMPTPSPTRG